MRYFIVAGLWIIISSCNKKITCSKTFLNQVSVAYKSKYGETCNYRLFNNFNCYLFDSGCLNRFLTDDQKNDTIYVANLHNHVTANSYAVIWSKVDTISYIDSGDQAKMKPSKLADGLFKPQFLSEIARWDENAPYFDVKESEQISMSVVRVIRVGENRRVTSYKDFMIPGSAYIEEKW